MLYSSYYCFNNSNDNISDTNNKKGGIMSNSENLQPFTKENAKYYGKKGGKKSGKVRAERKSIKEQLRLLLNMPISDEKNIKMLENSGFEYEEMNNQLLLTYTLFQKGVSGDTKSIALIFKLIQEEDVEKTNNMSDLLTGLFI